MLELGEKKMRGRIRSVIYGRQYGFIVLNGKDYFFHKDDYDGNWDQLIDDHNKDGSHIEVEFTEAESSRGLRASEVRRVE